MGVVDEVRQKTDIVAVIGQYAKLTKAGQSFRAPCPFHSEKNPSFYVRPAQQDWHCFGACATGGDVFSFIMKKEGVSFGEALRMLADRAGVVLTARSEQESKVRARLYQVNQSAARFFHAQLLESPAAGPVRDYLSRRGLAPQTVVDFQLGYAPDSWSALKGELTKIGYNESELLNAGVITASERNTTYDRFRNKLMFPILDDRSRVTGFGARVLDDSLPKYINSPQTPVFDKSGNLYGIQLAREAIRKQGLAIIVEGYMDVIIAHQYGFKNVIACMGTSITERQLGTIQKLTTNLALALDADNAGEEAMLKGIGYENILGSEVMVVALPAGKDPDEVIKEDAENWRRLVAGAVPVMDYTFSTVAAGSDLTSAGGKSRAADRLMPLIAAMTGSIRRGQYLIKLADLLGVKYEDVKAALGRLKPDRRARETRTETLARALGHIVSSPIENSCIALLLQNPELKGQSDTLLPEYLESSQNREILAAYRQGDDIPSLRERLDGSIHEHLDFLLAMNLRKTQIERRFAEHALRLREKYLRRLELMKKEILSLEAQSGGSAAELAKLQEQGIDVSVQLGDVFARKGYGKPRPWRREK